MVDESERLWKHIDGLHQSVGDHCIRLTKLEQTHLYSKESQIKALIIVVALVAVAEFIYLLIR